MLGQWRDFHLKRALNQYTVGTDRNRNFITDCYITTQNDTYDKEKSRQLARKCTYSTNLPIRLKTVLWISCQKCRIEMWKIYAWKNKSCPSMQNFTAETNHQSAHSKCIGNQTARKRNALLLSSVREHFANPGSIQLRSDQVLLWTSMPRISSMCTNIPHGDDNEILAHNCMESSMAPPTTATTNNLNDQHWGLSQWIWFRSVK